MFVPWALMALWSLSKILLRSGSCRIYPLVASVLVYTGGVGGAALPLNAPPAPLPLGAAHLHGIVSKVLQQVFLLLCCTDENFLSDLSVGVGDMSDSLL